MPTPSSWLPSHLGGGADQITDFTAGAMGEVLKMRQIHVGYVDGVSNLSDFVALSRERRQHDRARRSEWHECF